ncbi:MAG: penicillin-binding protein 2 [Chitinispirillales bacterium]|jgi:penicillin-binding protein 2|nr:penicillin-binding protein 2 [Chitinispirillales bacterium]
MATGRRIQDEPHERRAKSLIVIVVCCLAFSVLPANLYRLQVKNAAENIRLSNENSMREQIVLPPRGRILDRNGNELARNRPAYSICVLPYRLRNSQDVIQSLCKIRDASGAVVFDSATLAQQFRKANSRKFDLSRIKEDVSIDVVSIVEERYMELPGIVVETESRREYPYGASAFHVVGYMGEIPEKEFDTLRNQDYYWGDLMGRSGLERSYESVMRGKCGREYLEVNAYGKSLGAVESIQKIDPVYGNDLYLSLDINLQMAAEQAFPDSLKGAVVALDPRNGDVLVMFSNPSVDPNIFSAAMSVKSKTWAAVASDRNLPLNNRAIAGVYPPGSTFKVLSGLAGLEAGSINKDSRLPSACGGSFKFGSRIAKCHKQTGHGSLSYISAIQYSCNVYFYQLGLRIGDTRINRYAQMFGLGDITGIDLPGEKAGYLSGEKAYNERFASRNWRWTQGLVMDLAIGQQQVLTPLQLALMVGGMGNGKNVYQPHLLNEERNRDGILVSQKRPHVKSRLELNQYTLDVTRDALAAVVRPGGTGSRAAVPGIAVGGKTGSAQNPHSDLSHALFIACAPVDDPVIAVAVVVENAGGGGAVAAPVAGALLKYFFSETKEGKIVYQKYNPEGQKPKRPLVALAPAPAAAATDGGPAGGGADEAAPADIGTSPPAQQGGANE